MVAKNASVPLFAIVLYLGFAPGAAAAPNCAAEKQKLDAIKARYEALAMDRSLARSDPDREEGAAELMGTEEEWNRISKEMLDAERAYIKCLESGR